MWFLFHASYSVAWNPKKSSSNTAELMNRCSGKTYEVFVWVQNARSSMMLQKSVTIINLTASTAIYVWNIHLHSSCSLQALTYPLQVIWVDEWLALVSSTLRHWKARCVLPDGQELMRCLSLSTSTPLWHLPLPGYLPQEYVTSLFNYSVPLPAPEGGIRLDPSPTPAPLWYQGPPRAYILQVGIC